MTTNRDSPNAQSAQSQMPLLDNQCRNGCGYFGNPAWHGYCSKCYRDIHLKGEYAIANEAQRRSSLQSAAATSSLQNFQNFEQKKRSIEQKKSGTMKTFFRKSVSSANQDPYQEKKTSEASARLLGSPVSSTASAAASAPPPMTPGSVNDVGRELSDFLCTLPDSAALDFSKQVKIILDKLNELAAHNANGDQLADCLQRFYRTIKERINTHKFYVDVNGMQRQKLIDYSERFVTNKTYTTLFGACSDEEADLRVQQRIRSLHFVTTTMLDALIDLQNLDVRGELDHAITALIEMDSRRPPTDKIAALLDSCTYVQRAVKATKRAAPSADDFLPALIYALLKANPPLLRSNMRYIDRVTMPERLSSGASAYYYTNLCAAVTFLETLEARALGLSERQLEDYISRALPASDTLWLHGCAGQIAEERYSSQFSDIHRRFDRLLEVRLRLAADLSAFRTQMLSAVDECLQTTLISLPSESTPAENDSDPNAAQPTGTADTEHQSAHSAAGSLDQLRPEVAPLP